MSILSTDTAVVEVAKALHRGQNGCRRDIDGQPNCEAWTPDPHEAHATEYVRTGAHYLRRCPAHDSYEPCPTCHAYIAAGL